MIKKYVLLVLLFPSIVLSQTERYPVFNNCKGEQINSIEACFKTTTKKDFFAEFKKPSVIESENFKGTVNAVFIVTAEGDFKLIYINSPYLELKQEIERTFNTFPRITPGWYNNHAVEMRFVLPITFPLEDNFEELQEQKNVNEKESILDVIEKNSIEDSDFSEDNNQLNIPFTHQKYVDYEFAMHKESGTHTASKPYLYSEVNKYYNITEEKTKFLKPEVKSWLGNKIWNEHLLQIKNEDYWLTMDFLLDVQIGKDNSDISYTYNNSRVLAVNGGIGNKFSYYATIYESQGRFAEYVNNYITNPALNIRPKFSEGLVPGRGKSKVFKTDAYDYPVAEGYLSYTPNKFMQFQFGNGKNFIGDGYRSFILSDVSSPTTYLKMKADFWRLQYTNIWMWNTEPSLSAISDPNEHARKYVAAHYLSINLNKKLNIGLFETSISTGENGFDAGFLNPVMFYRAVEFNRGEDAGNAIVGLTGKYKLNNNISLYSQLIIDEFSVGNLNDLGKWQNKFAYQLGVKYFNAFNVENLFLQLEYNAARPYTFAHKSPVLNYGNYSQPLGHLWGANFWEAIAIARYKKDRWSGSAKVILGKKGFDYQDQAVSYGGDIYQSYEDRFGDVGNELAQGNTANIFILDVEGNYLLNPSNNLSLYAGVTYRSFSPEVSLIGFPEGNTFWFSIGVKADLFNRYFDF